MWIDAYHGSALDITQQDGFQAGDDGPIDRRLHAHFTDDDRVATRFACGTNRGEHNRTDGGYLHHVRLCADEVYTIPQKQYPHGAYESDQVAIARAAIGIALDPATYSDAKELFTAWFKRSRLCDDEFLAERIFELLQAGEPVTAEDVGAVYAFDSTDDPGGFCVANYVTNFDGGLFGIDRNAIAERMRSHLADEGYTLIRYRNTAPMEVDEGESRTSYIPVTDDAIAVQGVEWVSEPPPPANRPRTPSNKSAASPSL